MESLNFEQREYYKKSLADFKSDEPTYLFLRDCATQLEAELLARPSKGRIRNYAEAVRVLTIHCEYLAYRLGLEHGKNTDK